MVDDDAEHEFRDFTATDRRGHFGTQSSNRLLQSLKSQSRIEILVRDEWANRDQQPMCIRRRRDFTDDQTA